MANTITIAASSLVTKYYGSTSTVISTEARQGRYSTHSSLLVGVMRFAGLADIDWSSKVITGISLSVTHGDAGAYNGTSKTFQLWGSNYQVNNDTTVNGSAFISGLSALGSFSGAVRTGTVVTCSMPSDNATMFNNLVSYLESGAKDTLCLYINESLDGDYTPNYLDVTAASITITYEDSTVKYYNGSAWKNCLVKYYNGSTWKNCLVKYYNGSAWKTIGG